MASFIFNTNPFESVLVPKIDLIDSTGEPVVYTDVNGIEQQEQEIILWCYNTQVDVEQLYLSHGYVFNVKFDSSEFYKELLKALDNALVEGMTVLALKTLMAAMLGIKPVIEFEETVEEVASADGYHIVVTDKNVYKINSAFTLSSSVVVGSQLHSGDIVITDLQYFDNVTKRDWWTSIDRINLVANQKTLPFSIGFGKQVFVGNYQSQLFFKNSFEPISKAIDGTIVFPVNGLADDVTEFNRIINENGINQYFTDIPAGGVKLINPVDFLFTNFIGNNTAGVVFSFNSSV